ncbi:hypothetical protein QJQ45_022631 [Haematococcus lacustris]|nr:hypothetical protein QJQ45_022631 [Haematococcus lacustris]
MGGPGSGRKRKDGPDKRPAGSTSKKRPVTTPPDSEIEVVEPVQLARQPAGWKVEKMCDSNLWDFKSMDISTAINVLLELLDHAKAGKMKPSTWKQMYSAMQKHYEKCQLLAGETATAKLIDDSQYKLVYDAINATVVGPDARSQEDPQAGTAGCCRNDDARWLNLAGMREPLLLPFVGPLPTLALANTLDLSCVAAKFRNRSVLQNNKPKYISFVRHKDPVMCPVRAIGLLLFEKYVNGAMKFPDATNNDEWRNEAFFTIEDPRKAVHYDTMRKDFNDLKQQEGMTFPKVLHAMRESVSSFLIALGCDPDKVRALGNWLCDSMLESYSQKTATDVVLIVGGYAWETLRMRCFFHPRFLLPVPDKLLFVVFPFLKTLELQAAEVSKDPKRPSPKYVCTALKEVARVLVQDTTHGVVEGIMKGRLLSPLLSSPLAQLLWKEEQFLHLVGQHKQAMEAKVYDEFAPQSLEDTMTTLQRTVMQMPLALTGVLGLAVRCAPIIQGMQPGMQPGSSHQPIQSPSAAQPSGDSYYSQQLSRFKVVVYCLKTIQRQRHISTLREAAEVVQCEANAHFLEVANASHGPNKKRTSRAWSGYLSWLETAYKLEISVARKWMQNPLASEAQIDAMLSAAQLPKADVTTPMKLLQQARAATGTQAPAVVWVRRQLAFPSPPTAALAARGTPAAAPPCSPAAAAAQLAALAARGTPAAAPPCSPAAAAAQLAALAARGTPAATPPCSPAAAAAQLAALAARGTPAATPPCSPAAAAAQLAALAARGTPAATPPCSPAAAAAQLAALAARGTPAAAPPCSPAAAAAQLAALAARGTPAATPPCSPAAAAALTALGTTAGSSSAATHHIAASADLLVTEMVRAARERGCKQSQALKEVVTRMPTHVKKALAQALQLPVKDDAAGKQPQSGYALFCGMKRAVIGSHALSGAWQGAAQDVYAAYAAILNNLEQRLGC